MNFKVSLNTKAAESEKLNAASVKNNGNSETLAGQRIAFSNSQMT